MISKKISTITPSPTLAISAKEKKMLKEGIDIIGFGAGEPDFDTPLQIKEAAKKAIDEGFTKYTASSGIQELKESVCLNFKKNNLNYLPQNILISCGAKHSIFNTILTLCEKDDEVILPSPYWVSYPEMIKIADAKIVIIETTLKNNFKITPQQLKKAITSKTKLFILNSPSNPTGMVYTKEELESISEILVKAGVFCLSDEIYDKLIYDKTQHISIASLGKKIKDLTIVINGVSKTYAMTGWRIGYAAAPLEIIKAMDNLQSHSTSNPTSISQKAALAALQSSPKAVIYMVSEFKKRRDYMVKRLNKINGITCLNPQGAFYVFPDISQLFGKSYQGKPIKDSITLTELLLTEAKIAVVPGIAFGKDNHIRLSYATSYEKIVKGLNRLAEFVNNSKG